MARLTGLFSEALGRMTMASIEGGSAGQCAVLQEMETP